MHMFGFTEWFMLAAFAAAAAVCVYALLLYRKSVMIRRARFVLRLMDRLRQDEDIRYAQYLFDTKSRWYGSDFHHSGELKRRVDKTLDFFAFICHLRSTSVLNDKEFSFFQPAIDTALRCKDTRNYFYNLYHFTQANEQNMPFGELFRYAQKHKCLRRDFYDMQAWRQSGRYTKHMKW